MQDKPRLLLFDDDQKTADLIKDSLEDDFEVTWCSTQEELDEKIDNSFDVIVTDVSIKDSDKTGYRLIDDLRRNLRLTRTPIVVYSAKVNIEDIRKEQGKLFFAYVDKASRIAGDCLLDQCKKAAKEKPNLVSWSTFRAYFERIGKLDAELDPEDLGSLYFHVDTSTLRTMRHLLDQLKKDDLQDDVWYALEDLAWDLYQRYKE